MDIICNSSQCPLDLWAPGYRNKVENIAFSAYATHQQQIDDFIEVFAAAGYPEDGATQTALLRQVGLTPENLSPYDLYYIEKEVNK